MKATSSSMQYVHSYCIELSRNSLFIQAFLKLEGFMIISDNVLHLWILRNDSKILP